MEYAIVWLFFAFFVGLIGKDRVLGFWESFLWALILSPVIGLIIVLLSKTEADKKHQQQVQANQLHQTEVLKTMAQTNNQANYAEELAKWKTQLDAGVITQDEFQKIKNKIMSKFD